jgi:citrate synthase
MNAPDDPWITAADAARALAVTRPTLYAYVSRGLIRSEAHAGSSRQRRYSRDDVDRLRRRAEARRNPETVATHALQWGMPILESSITLIAQGRVYYRGHDAVDLARSRSVAEVASLIWTGRFDAPFPAVALPAERTMSSRAPFIARAQSTLAMASTQDPFAFDLRAESVAHTGWRIVDILTRTATNARAPLSSIDDRLARAWHVRSGGGDVLRAALILCADHELNVSAFTARCVASAGANPYAAVIAGLAALEGAKHGGLTARVESMLASMRRERNLRSALAERLRRGESVDGFGHPLYRNGDPRAAALLDLLRDLYPRAPERVFADALADAGASVLRERPTVDFALAAVARVLRLPPGAPLTLFAIGRTIGWIGHAIEQYATGQIIRPRAKYVGTVPATIGSG